MIATFTGSVRMPTDEHHPDHASDVRHRREQADADVTRHTQTLDDGGNPEAERYIRTGGTEVDERHQPHLRELDRLVQSMFAWTGVAVIRFQVGQDNLLLTLGKPACLG